MKNKQRKIASLLFIITIVLLLLNLILVKFFSEEINQQEIEITDSEIDSLFKSALYNLGIKDEWINNKNESYLVKIPVDLPAVLILQEFNNVFDTNEVKIKSFEKKIGGSTIINFFSGDEEKLIAELIYNKDIKRKSVRAGFIVERSGSDYETDSLLLNYPEQFAFLITPSENSAAFAKKILLSEKEYLVYLNDNIDELKFKLSSDYSERRLNNSIREIVGTFPDAVFFMIDDKSQLYNSSVYSLLKEALDKRRISLIEENSFYNLKEEEENIFVNEFIRIINNASGGEDIIFVVTAEMFFNLDNEIKRYRKLGYRFVNPSAMLPIK